MTEQAEQREQAAQEAERVYEHQRERDASDPEGWYGLGVKNLLHAPMSIRLLEVVDGAAFSPDRMYRYALWRLVGHIKPVAGTVLNVIGLNPSSADESENDPTIRRCIGFARTWGMSGLVMTNLFAYRATDPKALRWSMDPIGRENDRFLVDAARSADRVLVAWGTRGGRRALDVLKILADIGIPVYCLGDTRDGYPRHPLYVPGDYVPTRHGSGRCR